MLVILCHINEPVYLFDTDKTNRLIPSTTIRLCKNSPCRKVRLRFNAPENIIILRETVYQQLLAQGIDDLRYYQQHKGIHHD